MGIPAEILNQGEFVLLYHIHALLLKVWETELQLSELRDALIVTVFSNVDKETQSGFHPSSGAMYMIFTARHLQLKQPLYIIFIDRPKTQ